MKKKKKKFSLSGFLSDAWLDLKFKLILIGSVFVAFLIVILLVVTDLQSDKNLLERTANKYETYIDQLLMKKFSVDELKEMNNDQLKLAVDVVIDEANNKVINAPKLNDFILPVKDDNYTTMFKISRTPKTTWVQEDIEDFWIELESLDIKNLDEKNFEFLKARLKDIR